MQNAAENWEKMMERFLQENLQSAAESCVKIERGDFC